MKRFIGLFTAVILMVLCATPALAAGLRISPPSVELDVPADGSSEVEFLVYDFTGDLGISLENIPLRVEPTTVPVTAKEEGTRVVLTFYGDESLGSKIYEGKIRFLAMTGGTVAMGIKVRATVTNLVEGQTPVPATPEESQPVTETSAPEEASTEEVTETLPEESPSGAQVVEPSQEVEKTSPEQTSPVPPPALGKTEWPILPIVGIAAGAAIVITLIIVIARRRRY